MILAGKRLVPELQRWGRNVQFYLVDYGQGGPTAVVESMVWRQRTPEEEALPISPTFDLGVEAAQELFEQLWEQGFRSIHDRGGSDRLDAARKEHIEDLRRAAKLDRGS